MNDLIFVENCESAKLSKDKLILFLAYLKEKDGQEDEHWEGETLDYANAIEVVEKAIKTFDDNEYEYHYWAWW